MREVVIMSNREKREALARVVVQAMYLMDDLPDKDHMTVRSVRQRSLAFLWEAQGEAISRLRAAGKPRSRAVLLQKRAKA